MSSTPARQPSSLEPEGSITSARLNSLPSPPLRSRVPGVALAGAALVLVFGGITWALVRQGEDLHEAASRITPAQSAPAVQVPVLPPMVASAVAEPVPVSRLTTTSAFASSAVSPRPIEAEPLVVPAVATAATMPPRHVTRAHHVERPLTDLVASETPDLDNPYEEPGDPPAASPAASAPSPASSPSVDQSRLFEVRK